VTFSFLQLLTKAEKVFFSRLQKPALLDVFMCNFNQILNEMQAKYFDYFFLMWFNQVLYFKN